MTSKQKDTIEQIKIRIEKLNDFTKSSITKLSCTKHLFLYIIRERTNYPVSKNTEIFCNIQINSNGNIVKGKWNQYQALETKKEFY